MTKLNKTTVWAILLFLSSLLFPNPADAFSSNAYKNPAYKEAIFKTCADYITLVKAGQCPKPIIKRSEKSFQKEGVLGVRSVANFYGIVAYTEKSDPLLGVDKMCQVGLYACASIKDTDFDGGDKACSSLCTKKNCGDPYIYYACKATSQTTEVLDGRKVCSDKSVEKCFTENDTLKFKDTPYKTAFKDYTISTLEKLKESQSKEEVRILDWVLNKELLHMVNHYENYGHHEFSPKEILYFAFPETIKEAAIEMEAALRESFKKKGRDLSHLVKELFVMKGPPPYGPENDKAHQKLWGDKALKNDLKAKINSLLRGLDDKQAYEIKKIVTDINSVRLSADDRFEILKAVVRLTKDHFGKRAKSFGDVFAKSKKVNLWRTLAKSVPLSYGLQKRLKVIEALKPLSEYQLLQVIHYGKFHDVYPDDLPKIRNLLGSLLERMENVRKLDVRYSSNIPDYLIGIELSDEVLKKLIGSPVYSSDMRKIIIEFYKKTAEPDFTSPKGQIVYRLYKPSNKFEKFIQAISFLNFRTKDFYNVQTYRSPPEALQKMEALKSLTEMPEEKLDKLLSEAFLEELKASVPIQKTALPPLPGVENPVVFESYQAVLNKLNE